MNRPQISIATPVQVQVPDDVLSVLEQVITYLLHGGATTGGSSPTPPTVAPPLLPAPLPDHTSVGDAIDAVTFEPHLQLAMRLGAMLEGGSLTGPWNAGDNGMSFGPFQIYTVAHPEVSRAEAENPSWAVNFMLPEYEIAAQEVDPALWQSDPKAAAALTVFKAERPAAMYPQDRIDAGWQAITYTPSEVNPLATN